MKKVSFTCDESAIDLYINVLVKLSEIAARDKNAKIRIGGSEYKFIGKDGNDDVTDLSIDDKLYATLSSYEKRDFTIRRESNMPKSTPVTPTFTNVPDTTTSSLPTFTGPDGTVGDSDGTTPTVTSTTLTTDELGSIQSIINGKVLRNERFTAFDITKELRNQGKSIKHYVVKEAVHSMYENGEMGYYQRDLNSNIGNPPPFEYHP